MPPKSVTPSISETAFDCPHCGAYTTQDWFRLHAKELSFEPLSPRSHHERIAVKFMAQGDSNPDMRIRLVKQFWKQIESGLVHVDRTTTNDVKAKEVENLFLNLCYNCKKVGVWVHESLVFPPQKDGMEPNADLPEEIIRDFEEARSILNLSPRGAAALLRLCIQKLCVALGGQGKTIDDDIGSLVGRGLSTLVQQSLDVVRVIGNNAVHPGVIDLKDDRDTAQSLFQLVNIIAEQMITNPKHVNELYKKLPAGNKKAIEDRDAKALQKTQ